MSKIQSAVIGLVESGYTMEEITNGQAELSEVSGPTAGGDTL